MSTMVNEGTSYEGNESPRKDPRKVLGRKDMRIYRETKEGWRDNALNNPNNVGHNSFLESTLNMILKYTIVIILLRSITMVCGTINISHNISKYSSHSDSMWETFGKIMWNIVSST